MKLALNQNNSNKYIIPARKIIFSILLFVSYLMLIFSNFIFEPIMKEWFWLFFFIWFFAFGIGFFIFMPFWMNMFTYPVRKWILSNIRCHKCNSQLSKCDAAFRGIDASHFLSFAVACDNCQRAFFLETGIFDKTLKFSFDKQSLWIKNYQRKYFSKTFPVPLSVWILNYLFIFPSVFIIIVVAVFRLYYGLSSMGRSAMRTGK